MATTIVSGMEAKIPARVGLLYRVGLPQDVRQVLGVHEGDYVVFHVSDNEVKIKKL